MLIKPGRTQSGSSIWIQAMCYSHLTTRHCVYTRHHPEWRRQTTYLQSAVITQHQSLLAPKFRQHY